MSLNPNLLAWCCAVGEDAFHDGVPRSSNVGDALPNVNFTDPERAEMREAWAIGWDREWLRSARLGKPH